MAWTLRRGDGVDGGVAAMAMAWARSRGDGGGRSINRRATAGTLGSTKTSATILSYGASEQQSHDIFRLLLQEFLTTIIIFKRTPLVNK